MQTDILEKSPQWKNLLYTRGQPAFSNRMREEYFVLFK